MPDDVERTVKTDGGAVRTLVLLRKEQGPRGRPALILTDDGVRFIERLYACNCTMEEVAAELGVSVEVLGSPANRELNRLARDNGARRFNAEIRQAQRAIMKRGDARMAIWLGKQYLGQTDRLEASVQVERKTADDITWDDIGELVAKEKKRR